MPFRDNETHLRDILEGLDQIDSFLGNMNLDAYKADKKTQPAVERQLQIIMEAAKRLGMRLMPCVQGQTGRGFTGWVISCGTATIKSMMRLSGTR